MSEKHYDDSIETELGGAHGRLPGKPRSESFYRSCPCCGHASWGPEKRECKQVASLLALLKEARERYQRLSLSADLLQAASDDDAEGRAEVVKELEESDAFVARIDAEVPE